MQEIKQKTDIVFYLISELQILSIFLKILALFRSVFEPILSQYFHFLPPEKLIFFHMACLNFQVVENGNILMDHSDFQSFVRK